MSAQRPVVSIVIPAFNCEKTIAKCLDSILNLWYHPLDVIIVDDGSTDNTPHILKQYPDIRVFKTPNTGPSRARNLGIEHAAGEFVAFTDADCIVREDWINELFRGFSDPSVGGVGGDQQSPKDEHPFGKIVHSFMKTVGFISDYMKTARTMIRTQHNPTCNVMYRKEVLEEAGGFDEKLWPGEDVDIDLKITRNGYKLFYNPDAVVRHYRPQTFARFANMMKRYGWAQAYLVKKYGFFRPIQFVPVFMTILLVLFVLLFLQFPLSTIKFLVAGAAALVFIFFLKTMSPKKSVFFAFLFILLIINWNFGFYTGIIEGFIQKK